MLKTNNRTFFRIIGSVLFASAMAAMLCSCSSEVSTNSPPAADVAAVTHENNGIEGKWYGSWKNDWGEVTEIIVGITGSGQDRYTIAVYDSDEKYVELEIACTLVEKNTLIFDRNEFLDSGKGIVADGRLQGEFKGEEDGEFTLYRVREKAEI